MLLLRTREGDAAEAKDGRGRAGTAGSNRGRGPRSPRQRLSTTADPCPNSPWLAVIPTRAPSTCRPSA